MDSLNTAAHIVFSTPELVSLILTSLSFSELLKASLVSKHFRAMILSTPSLKRTLLLLPSCSRRPRHRNYHFAEEYLMNNNLVYSFPLYDPHTRYRPHGCVLPMKRDFGPLTEFPFKSQSRSWRDMLVLGEIWGKPAVIKKLRIREKVKIRSENLFRDRVMMFEDGFRCGDFWDLARDCGESGLGGDRSVMLLCASRPEQVDGAIGLVLIINAHAWYKRTWGVWLRYLYRARKRNGKKMGWREWFQVLVGGDRKSVDGKVIRKEKWFRSDRLLQRMNEDEDAVLEITIHKIQTRWGWLGFPWGGEVRAKLEKVGFIKEPETKWYYAE